MNKITKSLFEKQIDFSCKHFIFKDCSYYPCHKMEKEINCFFCYCPFYPCDSKIGKGKWINSGPMRVFDCSECDFIHRDEVVKRIIELFYEGKNINQIVRIIKKELKK